MELKSHPRLNVLVAFPYWVKSMDVTLLEHQERLNILLDSGAFTAFKLGKEITLDGYCRFLDEFQGNPWGYMTLDVIGDAKATLANYRVMLDRGYRPIPIFTRGEDPSVLDDYFKTSEVVGLGGVATGPTSGYIKWIWPHFRGRHCHILGFSKLGMMKMIRPYSCDSNSWEAGGRYARIPIYMGRGKFVALGKADFEERPKREIIDRIAAMGFDPYAFRHRVSWHGGNSHARYLGCMSWVAAQLDIRQSLGTRFFLALSAGRLDMLVGCYLRRTTGDWHGLGYHVTGKAIRPAKVEVVA